MSKTKILFSGLFLAIFMAGNAYSGNIGDISALSITFEQNPANQYQLAKSTFLPETYDDLGLSGRHNTKYDFNKNDCSSYPLSSCPMGATCTKCPFAKKYKVTSCSSPYISTLKGCDCPALVKMVYANDKCVQYCSSPIQMKSWCIKKECTPNNPATGCTNGTQSCDNGCGGTFKCCIACTDTVTTKPANSSYTYSSCKDDDGTKNIQTGWTCNAGYHKYGDNLCDKDCNVTNCAGYTLTSCPANATCSSCTKTAANCSTDGTVYKIDSCKDGFVKSGDTCACKPLPDLTPICLFGTKDGSDGCGGTRKVCAAASAKILYSDHTVCQHVLPEKTAIAVIHDEANKKALALKWFSKKWADAKTYAKSYTTAGTSAGDWYAGSKAEYKKVRDQHDALNPTIIALNNNDIQTRVYGRGWTGEEADSSKAYVYYVDAKTEDAIFKTELKSTEVGFRPILDYSKYAITYCEEDGLTPQQKCLDEGYRLKEDWPKPTASNETVIPSSMLANFMKKIFELKPALALTAGNLTTPMTDPLLDQIDPIGPITGGGTGGTTINTATYTFTVTATCPYDSNYVKGEWKRNISINGCNSNCETCDSTMSKCLKCKDGYTLSGDICLKELDPGTGGCSGTTRMCNGKQYCCPSGAKTPCDSGYSTGGNATFQMCFTTADSAMQDTAILP